MQFVRVPFKDRVIVDHRLIHRPNQFIVNIERPQDPFLRYFNEFNDDILTNILDQCLISLETLATYGQIHNDIKPQNYLLKFENGDFSKFSVFLSDFGLVGNDVQGGTPIFASPECYGVKTTKSDIFSLGRVFLFVLLPSTQFLKWLYLPICNRDDQLLLPDQVQAEPVLEMISNMSEIELNRRIDLKSLRQKFNQLKDSNLIKLNGTAIEKIDSILTRNLAQSIQDYLAELDHLS